jgi:cytochrome c-type biogenesis protein CcmE
MTTIQIKLLVAGVVLLGAIGYLAFAGVKSGWVYFIDVKTFLDDPQYRTQRVRLHGAVAADGFETSSAGLRAAFRLTDPDDAAGPSVPVVYRGNIPEMFGVGKNVVVEGRSDAAGVFQADVLMTKCASKYESGSPHAEAKP